MLRRIRALAVASVILGACTNTGKGPPGPQYVDDEDHDGVKDVDDKCAGQVEDWDGFNDADGCPETDNDNDGIADTSDECPSVPGDGDPAGCPGVAEARKLASATPTDLDPDRDGIVGDDDTCPTEAEDKDGFDDKDGCPDPDNDKDSILDDQDRCPTSREDGKGNKPTDGCPSADADRDGIVDEEDDCPNTVGRATGKGCPDRDSDGIKDTDRYGKTFRDGAFGVDKCPSKAENGSDGDGCPGLDADNDRNPNSRDRCPEDAEDFDAESDEDGCPE